MFAFLITSHRNPAIDCCKCPLIFSRALHYLTFVLNAMGRMTTVCQWRLWHQYVFLHLSRFLCMCMQVCLCIFMSACIKWEWVWVADEWESRCIPFGPGSLIEKHRSCQGEHCAFLHIKIAKGYWQTVCSHWIKSQDFPPCGLNRSVCQKVRHSARINQLAPSIFSVTKC